MLVNEIRSDREWKFVLDLHPRITVLTGLGPDHQQRIVGMIEDVVLGRPTEVHAVFEVQGHQWSLPQWADAIRSVDVERINPVVHGHHLPGGSSSPDGADEEMANVERRLIVANQRVADAVTALTSALVELGEIGREALGALGAPPEDVLPCAEHALAIAEARRVIAERAVRASEMALEAFDHPPPLQAAQSGDVLPAPAAVAPARSSASGNIFDPPEVAGTADPPDAADAANATIIAAVRHALRDAERECDPDDGLVALKRRVALLRQRRAHTRAPAPPEWMLSSARAALEDARRELADSEQMSSPLHLSAVDAAQVEAAHLAVIDAEARCQGRLARSRAKRRLLAAQSTEGEVLAPLGLTSYEEYLLRCVSGDRLISLARVERARLACADAEAVWSQLQQGVMSDEAQSLAREEADVRADAAGVLGPDLARASLADIEGRLHALVTDPAEQPGVERLHRVLTEAGLRLSAQTDMISLARAWVDERPDQDVSFDLGHARAPAGLHQGILEFPSGAAVAIGERARAEPAIVDRGARSGGIGGMGLSSVASVGRHNRSRLVGELAAVRAGLAAASAGAERAGDDVRRARALAGRDPVDRETVVQARRNELLARRRLHEAQVAAAIAQARVSEARQRRLALSSGPSSTAQRWGADALSSAAEIYVLARLAAVRSVGALGSLPLVMVDPLTGLTPSDVSGVLEVLARMSEVVQIIFMSEQPEIVTWAEGLGEGSTAIHRFGRPATPPTAA